MIGDRNTHISDINTKYLGTRQGTVRSRSFITSPTTGAPLGIGGTTVTQVGPVTTLGQLPVITTPSGALSNSPVVRRHFETDIQTPGFDTGAVHTQQPAEYWDNDVDGKVRIAGAGASTGVGVRKPSCFERCTNCPSICGCPWWVALLLALLSIGAIVGGLMASSLNSTKHAINDAAETVANGTHRISEEGIANNNVFTNNTEVGASDSSRTSTNVTDSKETTTDRKEILNCNEGYFLNNGKCLSCPGESKWNGTHCIKTQLVNTTTTTITNSSGTFVIPNEGSTHPVSHE